MHDVMQVYLATIGQVEPGQEPGILELILHADLVVQLVLLVLVGMSIACWVIILNKYTAVRKARKATDAFLAAFWKAPRLDRFYEGVDTYRDSPVAQTFKAGYVELTRLNSADDGGGDAGMALGGEDNLVRALRRTMSSERRGLERLTTFLATTGSTAPFIGLFGTVWGILRAFQKIGATGQATVATVGPDIAHALIATAVGLAAAIPAVMAYNFFNSNIRGLVGEMETFSDDFLNIVKRHFRAR